MSLREPMPDIRQMKVVRETDQKAEDTKEAREVKQIHYEIRDTLRQLRNELEEHKLARVNYDEQLARIRTSIVELNLEAARQRRVTEAPQQRFYRPVNQAVVHDRATGRTATEAALVNEVGRIQREIDQMHYIGETHAPVRPLRQPTPEMLPIERRRMETESLRARQDRELHMMASVVFGPSDLAGLATCTPSRGGSWHGESTPEELRAEARRYDMRYPVYREDQSRKAATDRWQEICDG